jgi:hypothetical protein
VDSVLTETFKVLGGLNNTAPAKNGDDDEEENNDGDDVDGNADGQGSVSA